MNLSSRGKDFPTGCYIWYNIIWYSAQQNLISFWIDVYHAWRNAMVGVIYFIVYLNFATKIDITTKWVSDKTLFVWLPLSRTYNPRFRCCFVGPCYKWIRQYLLCYFGKCTKYKWCHVELENMFDNIYVCICFMKFVAQVLMDLSIIFHCRL